MNTSHTPLTPGKDLRRQPRRANDAIFAAALVCCVCIMLLCMHVSGMFVPKAVHEAAPKDSGYTFTDLAPKDAGTVQSVTVTAQQASWTLTPEELPSLDKQKAANVLAIGVSIISRMTVEGAPADFGMDAPALTAVFTYENGSSMRLTIGDPVSGMQGRYAAVDTLPGIFVISDTLYRTLDIPKEYLYTVPSLDTHFSSATLLEVMIEQPGKERICIRRVVENNPFNTVAEFTAPIHYPCNATRTGELFLALDALQPQYVLPKDDITADISPRAVLTLTDEKGESVLYLGMRDTVPVLQFADSDTLYALADGALDFLKTVTVAWLAEQTPGLVMMNQVQTLTVTCGAENYCFDLTAADAATACVLNGKPLDRDTFVNVYKQCIGLLIERYAADAVWTTDTEADARFTYLLKDGTAFTLAFASYDDTYYVIQREEDAHFLISSGKVRTVLDVIRALEKEGKSND